MMKNVSLSEQLEGHLENHERHEFAREVDSEARDAERTDVIAFIERRIAFLNSESQVGNTFRVDELLKTVRDIKAGKHEK